MLCSEVLSVGRMSSNISFGMRVCCSGREKITGAALVSAAEVFRGSAGEISGGAFISAAEIFAGGEDFARAACGKSIWKVTPRSC